jgi:hypothetical protein
MSGHKRICLMVVYVFATVQFVWCYLWLTRPYVNTRLYEEGSLHWSWRFGWCCDGGSGGRLTRVVLPDGLPAREAVTS